MKLWKLVIMLTVALFAASCVLLAVLGVLPYRIYVVHTGSMDPTIPSTSAVIVRTGEYRIGQPVSFVEQGEVITHRLVRIHSDGTIDTQGDANATIDPWHVSKSAIIGGVVAAPAHLGYWLVFLRNPLGLLSIVFGVLASWQLWSFTGARKPDERTPSPTPGRLKAVSRHAKRAQRFAHSVRA
ncbi:MAG: signal peptidase [Actinomycetota bacterium]|nr:signal peptidase [Actinomycetota bacterium]